MSTIAPTAQAHHLLTTTVRPLTEIAAEVGLSVAALEKRLERRYGMRSRELRTGQFPVMGRPTTGRTPWQVRLTAAERAVVEGAVARGRDGGATTDGEASCPSLVSGDWPSMYARMHHGYPRPCLIASRHGRDSHAGHEAGP